MRLRSDNDPPLKVMYRDMHLTLANDGYCRFKWSTTVAHAFDVLAKIFRGCGEEETQFMIGWEGSSIISAPTSLSNLLFSSAEPGLLFDAHDP